MEYVDLFETGKKIEKHFTNYLEPILGKGGVIAIHAPFGMGKTFFANKYKKYLETDKKVNSVIWNAAIYPHSILPFSWINGEIYRIVNLKKQPGRDLHDVSNGVFNVIRQAASLYGLHTPCENIKTITFNESITEYKEVLKNEVKDSTTVIFIDDLDRCKPDYALEIIEQLKYYFDVPNLVFILMINMDSLSETINHSYGIANPLAYLEKFLLSSIYNMEVNSENEYLDLYNTWLDGLNKQKREYERSIFSAKSLVYAAYIMQVNYREFSQKVLPTFGKLYSKENISFNNLEILELYMIIALKKPSLIAAFKRGHYTGMKEVFKQLMEADSPDEILACGNLELLKALMLIYSDDLNEKEIKYIVSGFRHVIPYSNTDIVEIRSHLRWLVAKYI